MVKNFWDWDSNTCEQYHLEAGEWSGFPGMGMPRASVIHVAGRFDLSQFKIDNELKLTQA